MPIKSLRRLVWDLKHVYQAQDVDFYTEKGVKLGIAKSFVGDVSLWVKDA